MEADFSDLCVSPIWILFVLLAPSASSTSSNVSEVSETSAQEIIDISAPLNAPPQTRKKRRCGGCHEEGHDLRNCPHNAGAEPKKKKKQTSSAAISNLDFTKLTYVFFDCETTGFSPKYAHLVQIAFRVVSIEGVISESRYSSFINPGVRINEKELPGRKVTQNHIKNAPTFMNVGLAIMNFFEQLNQDVILVAHNASFDLRFFLHAMDQAELTFPPNIKYVIDTCPIFRNHYEGQREFTRKFQSRSYL